MVEEGEGWGEEVVEEGECGGEVVVSGGVRMTKWHNAAKKPACVCGQCGWPLILCACGGDYMCAETIVCVCVRVCACACVCT